MSGSPKSELRNRKSVAKESSSGTANIEDAGPKAQERPDPKSASSLTRNASVYSFALVCILSFAVRFWLIWSPDEVVFDEVHFGKFASYYLRREYYFDVHPPLAKMLVALSGLLSSYNGNFLFDKIGMKYSKYGVPYILMRSWVCLFGSAIPPLVYLIMVESGYSSYLSLIVGLLVVFDNALVVHSRLILLDSILVFFVLASVLCYIKFYKHRYREFSARWRFWLAMTGVMLGCVLSCKMVGLFTFLMIGSAVLFDLWRLLDIRRGRTVSEVFRHLFARVAGLILLPFVIYLTAFYVHFAILTKSGPGDPYHTPDFQMQLEGNPLAADTPPISFGDAVTVQHVGTQAYLHSNPGRYPLRYEDGRVSSQGQQVTAIKEVNNTSNRWVFYPIREAQDFNAYLNKRNLRESISDQERDRWLIRNGEQVRLLHLDTKTFLRTHDVASPLTPTNMEFTTVPLNDTRNYNDTVWKIELDGRHDNNTLIYAWSSYFRIVSEQHRVAMYTHEGLLPEWGHGAQEINGIKKPKAKGTLWNIQHIAGRDLVKESADKKNIRRMWFFEKFVELQYLMLKHNSMLTSNHPYQSSPLSWPFALRGVSYWTKSDKQRQIYMMANPFGWWLTDFSLLLLGCFALGVALTMRRGACQVDPLVRRHMARSALFLASGWFFHYLPFFFMGRSLFLHHYFPALAFAYMAVGVVLQCLFVEDYRRFALFSWKSPNRAFFVSIPATVVSLALLALQIASFIYFAPFTYGSPGLSKDQIIGRKWFSLWDFQFSTN
ncbi:Dolichyl-phosphate-mannose--protein mannosyltransferase 4 [Spiromyces aspiralis]|uniref:Dolichyl-phosphate-mannose--protein mannosyltransferase 4 n=1 Tax=Spiromyces aspiralis TaxID=68401 RepID=A0ACC1HUJ7_9FUNG|nr:Dolichyl-phosphate-mannose--protein mannosyltransferase 4 [Spiromyces aspiralis]